MTASRRRKLRRIVSSEPKPQRCAIRLTGVRDSESTRRAAAAGHYGNLDEAIEPKPRACTKRKTPNSTAQTEIQIHERCTPDRGFAWEAFAGFEGGCLGFVDLVILTRYTASRCSNSRENRRAGLI